MLALALQTVKKKKRKTIKRKDSSRPLKLEKMFCLWEFDHIDGAYLP